MKMWIKQEVVRERLDKKQKIGEKKTDKIKGEERRKEGNLLGKKHSGGESK